MDRASSAASAIANDAVIAVPPLSARTAAPPSLGELIHACGDIVSASATRRAAAARGGTLANCLLRWLDGLSRDCCDPTGNELQQIANPLSGTSIDTRPPAGPLPANSPLLPSREAFLSGSAPEALWTVVVTLAFLPIDSQPLRTRIAAALVGESPPLLLPPLSLLLPPLSLVLPLHGNASAALRDRDSDIADSVDGVAATAPSPVHPLAVASPVSSVPVITISSSEEEEEEGERGGGSETEVISIHDSSSEAEDNINSNINSSNHNATEDEKQLSAGSAAAEAAAAAARTNPVVAAVAAITSKSLPARLPVKSVSVESLDSGEDGDDDGDEEGDSSPGCVASASVPSGDSAEALPPSLPSTTNDALLSLFPQPPTEADAAATTAAADGAAAMTGPAPPERLRGAATPVASLSCLRPAQRDFARRIASFLMPADGDVSASRRDESPAASIAAGAAAASSSPSSSSLLVQPREPTGSASAAISFMDAKAAVAAARIAAAAAAPPPSSISSSMGGRAHFFSGFQSSLADDVSPSASISLLLPPAGSHAPV